MTPYVTLCGLVLCNVVIHIRLDTNASKGANASAPPYGSDSVGPFRNGTTVANTITTQPKKRRKRIAACPTTRPLRETLCIHLSYPPFEAVCQLWVSQVATLTKECCRTYTVSRDAEQLYIRNKAYRLGRRGNRLAPATAVAPPRPRESRSRAVTTAIHSHDRRHLGTPRP